MTKRLSLLSVQHKHNDLKYIYVPPPALFLVILNKICTHFFISASFARLFCKYSVGCLNNSMNRYKKFGSSKSNVAFITEV